MEVKYYSYEELPERAKKPIPTSRVPVPINYVGWINGTYYTGEMNSNRKGLGGEAPKDPSTNPRTSRFSSMDNSQNPALGVLVRYEKDGPAGLRFTEDGRLAAMKKFAEGYAQKGTIQSGCKAAQVSRYTVAYWYERYPEFSRMLDEAREDYNDSLMEEVDRRGRRGIVRTKYFSYQGEVVDSREEVEYSDILLIFQTKSRLAQYRDKPVELGKERSVDWSKVADLMDGVPDSYVGPGTSTPLSTPTSTPITPTYNGVEVDRMEPEPEFQYRWRDDKADGQ